MACVQEQFWYDPHSAIIAAYEKTDQSILSHSSDLGRGGSTAVTAILLNGRRLWVANVGDSRGVLSQGGQARQMTIDHEPHTERLSIEDRGGFVSNMPGYYQIHQIKDQSYSNIRSQNIGFLFFSQEMSLE